MVVVLMSSLVLIVFPPFPAIQASAQESPSYLFVTEWRGENPGYAYEVGIAVDPSGENIYATDNSRHKILRFSSNGTYISDWGSFGSANGQLQYPTDVAVDSVGNVYVSEYQSGRIQKFDEGGNFLAQWPIGVKFAGEDHRGQQGISVDASDNIYVADTGYGQILKYSSDGQLLATIASPGAGEGELANPNDVAVGPDGNLYVADSFNNRVQVFFGNGTYLAQWNSVGDNGELYNPSSIAFDSEKNEVYVATGTIHRFSVNGAYLGPLTGESADNQITSMGIAVDSPNGAVYSIGSIQNSKAVAKFKDGQIVTKWTPEPPQDDSRGSVSSLVTDSEENVYIVDTLLNRIQKFASNGTMVGRWGMGGSGDGEFLEPVDIAIDPDGYLYVLEADNRRVQKFTPSGEFVTKWGGGEPDSTKGSFYYPNSIAVDSHGRVYVSDPANSRISIFTTDGTYVSQWNASMPNEVDPPDSFSETGFYSVGDMAIDSQGNLILVDSRLIDEPPYSYSRISKFSSNGTLMSSLYSFGDSGIPEQSLGISGLAIDSQDNLYVTDESSRVVKFSSNGTLLTEWGAPGTSSGEFGSAGAIAVGASGLVYVADSPARIQVFVSEDKASGLDRAPELIVPEMISANATEAQPMYTNVTYSVDAQDDIDSRETIAIDCSPESGSAFFAGYNNTVTCHATDSKGNTSTKTFIVWVESPPATPEVLPEASEQYRFVKKWGTRVDHGLLYASHVTADSNGNVYVLSIQVMDKIIQKYNSSGFPVAQFGTYGQGEGLLYSPFGIAVDSAGDNLYVIDSDPAKIVRFSAAGTFIEEWVINNDNSTGANPFLQDIAVGTDESIYVTDAGNSRVLRFSQDGMLVSEWGSYGESDGQFANANGISTDLSGKYVYVSDPWTNSIQKFTGNGTFVSKWRASNPQALATDPQGNVYSIDQNTGQIQRFGPDGQLTTPLNYTTADPSLYGPLDISINSKGDIYVAMQNGGVRILDGLGKPAGMILFTGESVGNFRSIAGVAIDSSGQFVYTLDGADGRVQKFTANGTFISQWLVGGLIGQATDIAVDSDGIVYVLGGNIVMFNGNGTVVASWGTVGDGDGELQAPSALAFDSNNTIYMADSGNYRIQAFSSDGVYLGEWPFGDSGETTGQQVYPTDIAVDSEGNISVLGSFTDTVEKFTNEGKLISELDLGRNIRDPRGFPVNALRIAIDQNDNLYVGYFDGAVRKLGSNGTFIAQLSSSGSGDGQVLFPTGIALDGNSDTVYIADGGNVRVNVFALDSTSIPEFGGLAALILAISIVGSIAAASRVFKSAGWSNHNRTY